MIPASFIGCKLKCGCMFQASSWWRLNCSSTTNWSLWPTSHGACWPTKRSTLSSMTSSPLSSKCPRSTAWAVSEMVSAVTPHGHSFSCLCLLLIFVKARWMFSDFCARGSRALGDLHHANQDFSVFASCVFQSVTFVTGTGNMMACTAPHFAVSWCAVRAVFCAILWARCPLYA